MVKLNEALTGYEMAVEPPCNPANIAGETYNFEQLTAEQADKLISIGSPYIRKKEAETPVETPVLVAAVPVVEKAERTAKLTEKTAE